MANTTTNTQNNIDIYNKNKIAELKAVHKFLNSVFGTPTASATTNTSKKTVAAKKPAKAAQPLQRLTPPKRHKFNKQQIFGYGPVVSPRSLTFNPL